MMASRSLQHFFSKGLRNISITSTRHHLKSVPYRCAQISPYNDARCHHLRVAGYSTAQAASSDSHSSEVKSGNYEFQAETAELLNIVAKSLYSENEVFIRELISNGSDALEKRRYQYLGQGDGSQDENYEINVHVNKQENTITFQDNGIGMTSEELISNLGVIARSGSKQFLEQLKSKGDGADTIIGQFGVGFYSAFMVGSKVIVYSRPHDADSQGFIWTSEGGISYNLSEAEDVEPGTKIIIHLKPECRKFANEDTVKEIVTKYNSFVGFPIKLNGIQLNNVQPLWTMDPSQIDEDMHLNFFRYLSGSQSDHYHYRLAYKTDAPLNIRSIFYVPESRPSLLEMAKETTSGVSLYSRKILIQDKSEHLLPKWLRFVRGVVDSEDIPLNLSRELLQNSSLIAKIRDTLTSRLVRYFKDQSKKDKEKYAAFHAAYKMFIAEGVMSESSQDKREEVVQLLRYETSLKPPNETVSFDDYIKNMGDDQRNIFYLCAPSRQLAESSPYFEAVKSKNMEVLFCYDPFDEIMMLQLKNYKGKQLFSVENEIVSDMFKDDQNPDNSENDLSPQMNKFKDWTKGVLGERVTDVKTTTKLDKHPVMVTVWEMGSVRHFLRSQYLVDPKGLSDKERGMLFKPVFQLNINHPVILKLSHLHETEPELSSLALEQLYENAMVSAGLIEDARPMVNRLNDLLTKVLEKIP